MLILAINCGSTSTKIALFEDEQQIAVESQNLNSAQIAAMNSFDAAVQVRGPSVETFLQKHGVRISDLDCVVARGGVPGPVESGAYIINDALLAALKQNGEDGGAVHHGNVSGVLAYRIASKAGIPAYIYDAVSVDELWPLARYSGIKDIPRYSRTHTLNTRAMAMEAAAERGRDYRELNIITAHLGGGNSVNIFCKGKLIDLVTSEEGGFSAERCGGLAGDTVLALVREKGIDTVSGYFHGNGGLVSYFGSNSALDAGRRADAGDKEAGNILDALAYQTSKCIASMAAVVKGDVDLIVLTGGILNSQRIADFIRSHVQFIAPVVVKPGEREMIALAKGALRVMRGEEMAKQL